MQISIPSGNLTMVDGWPGYLIPGPSTISMDVYHSESLCAVNYLLSGSATLIVSEDYGGFSSSISSVCTNVGTFDASELKLFGPKLTVTLTATEDYVLGYIEFEGLNQLPIAEIPSTTKVVYKKELTSRNPQLRVSSHGSCKVLKDGVVISTFTGTRVVGSGPGEYQVESESFTTVLVSEGSKFEPKYLFIDWLCDHV